MSKKTNRIQFNQQSFLVNVDLHFYINYHLVNFELYAHTILHHVSKQDFNLKTNQFIDVRCKKWEI